MYLENEESKAVAAHYGLAQEGPGVPGWLSHLDALKSREKIERPEVGPHVDRVAGYAAELAASVGTDPRRVEEIRLAALWHDIGKLMMPDKFFSDGLVVDSKDDRNAIVAHAADGRKIMEAVPGVPHAFLEIAAFHHERYDGNGYCGLKGEAIPFAARIVQVADVYDALKSARNYKPEWTTEKALSKMTYDAVPPRQGRREFDPFLLRRFVTLRSPELEIAPGAERRHLTDYAASLPMEDLRYLDEDPGVFIHSDGSREIDADDGGPASYFASNGTPIESVVFVRKLA